MNTGYYPVEWRIFGKSKAIAWLVEMEKIVVGELEKIRLGRGAADFLRA